MQKKNLLVLKIVKEMTNGKRIFMNKMHKNKKII